MFGRPKHGEGQALALREGVAFFYRSAGALGCHTRIRAGFPRDVERFMKHPHFIKDLTDLKRGAGQPRAPHPRNPDSDDGKSGRSMKK